MDKIVNLDNLVTREKQINIENILGDFYFKGSPTWNIEENPELIEFISKLIKPKSENIEEILKTHTSIPVGFISQKIEKQFKTIGIDNSILKMFQYTCPFNNFEHSSIIPTMFFCRDEEVDNKFFKIQENGRTLINKSFEEMIKDKEYMVENYMDISDLEYITELQQITMG